MLLRRKKNTPAKKFWQQNKTLSYEMIFPEKMARTMKRLRILFLT